MQYGILSDNRRSVTGMRYFSRLRQMHNWQKAQCTCLTYVFHNILTVLSRSHFGLHVDDTTCSVWRPGLRLACILKLLRHCSVLAKKLCGIDITVLAFATELLRNCRRLLLYYCVSVLYTVVTYSGVETQCTVLNCLSLSRAKTFASNQQLDKLKNETTTVCRKRIYSEQTEHK